MCFSWSRARIVYLAPAFPKKNTTGLFGRLLSHKESFSIETKNTFFLSSNSSGEKGQPDVAPQIEPLLLFFLASGFPCLRVVFSSSAADQAANVP